jgi:serine/threonine protein kinase
MSMNHQNIIKLYSIFNDETKVYLLMELGSDGQLYEIMKKKNSFCEETTAFLIK